MNEGDAQFDPAAALGDELMELVVLYLEGRLTGPQRDRLNSLLAEDPCNRDTFVAVCTHASLLASCVGIDEGVDEDVEGLGTVGSPAIDLPVGAAVEPPSGQWSRTPNPEPPFPTLSTTHYPLPTSDFVGSWAFSCMVATVIMGVMLLVCWAIEVNHHQHIAEAPSQSVPSDAMPEMVFVGRITGMVDVKWSDDPHYLPPPDFAHVPLDRKYILNSGLMEITYDSGAKVILQGPCTYEVESTAGGYLALGKLTAKVVSGQWSVASAKPQAANQKSEIKNQKSPSSFILHPSSLFSIRTPTAVVTDLGTEFGVEVSDRGRTKTQVFVGSVRLAAIDSGGEEADGGRVLLAGQTGVVRSGNAAIVVADADGSKTFARVMPPPKEVQKASADAYAELVMSLDPVAYYRMERPNDKKDLLTVFDSAPGGRHGKLSGVGRAGGLERLWCAGRFGGGLELRGEFFGDYVIAPRTPDSDSNQYSFAAWVLADSREEWATFVSEGGSRNWFRLKCDLTRDRWCARVTPFSGKDSVYSLAVEGESYPFPTGQWQHVAVVADGSVLHLYRNGVETKSLPCEGVIAVPPGKYLLLGCNNMAEDPTGLLPVSFWDGRIDEVTIFHRALSLEEVRQLYEGPAEKKGTGPICRNGPEGALHKLDLSPFSPASTERGVTP